MTEYWRTSNSNGGIPTLHAEKHCKNLKHCETIMKAERTSHPNAGMCSVCTGDSPANGGVKGGDRSTYEMARAIGEKNA